MRRTLRQRCGHGPNLTSLTNQANRSERLRKWGSVGTPPGVPRIPRLEAKSIAILHESPKVMLAGRNHCNNFDSNQYMLINRATKHCMLIDAADDWPDDWAAFIASSSLTLTHIFLTHCHIDNIINLNAFLSICGRQQQQRRRRQQAGDDEGEVDLEQTESDGSEAIALMWCPAEECWVQNFGRACERYCRFEEMHVTLPMMQRNLYTPQQMKDAVRSGFFDPRTAGHGFFRRKDILLSTATNRASSFMDFGDGVLLYYIFSPGHSPGHMMLHVPTEKLLFTGDLLFYNKVGRVDLPWATGTRLAESLRLFEAMPDNTVVLPGHGRMTTLGRERCENKALQQCYQRQDIGKQEVSIGFNGGYL
ncbi:metallo-beta-lactamase-like protein [Trypanosoma rangeli]|uniref:Metallo-beta-lactamase-like protein n=1 Tax=Trypanosoma rangeli TaxID=5698 RepID=A0A422MYI7_TRYRA|nr:metallo-beta-lactamase-like protein [Trypanosoma rangeli]RNE98257.1 metallo-beta-lactamase-like protein [Trypanosoma rangeli]|eukprot:RNE98257.1 metallo-beta-lactamase-like protein [Trypanosoma rangeli]